MALEPPGRLAGSLIRQLLARGSIAPVATIDGGYRIDCQSAFHLQNRSCDPLVRAHRREPTGDDLDEFDECR
jgi:hypothetical protein